MLAKEEVKFMAVNPLVFMKSNKNIQLWQMAITILSILSVMVVYMYAVAAKQSMRRITPHR